jgi:hypothetical protein
LGKEINSYEMLTHLAIPKGKLCSHPPPVKKFENVSRGRIRKSIFSHFSGLGPWTKCTNLVSIQIPQFHQMSTLSSPFYQPQSIVHSCLAHDVDVIKLSCACVSQSLSYLECRRVYVDDLWSPCFPSRGERQHTKVNKS